MRAGIYARVSTLDQEPENQLLELRRYAEVRGWTATEYVDRCSGAKDSRPALNLLLRDARRRKLDVVVCWRLDRSLRHLVMTLDELQGLGVGFGDHRRGDRRYNGRWEAPDACSGGDQPVRTRAHRRARQSRLGASPAARATPWSAGTPDH